MAQVAWIGLGVMGYPMAGHLAGKGGHSVVVYNRNGAKAAAWVAEYSGRSAATPAAAAEGAEFVFCCVGNDDDLRAVTTGEHGAFHGMGEGTVFVDHTTASAEVARELSSALGRAGSSVPRCTGLGRPGRRAKRRADRHGRRRARKRSRAPNRSFRSVRARGEPDRARGRRSARQDGQPDLHRRHAAGPRRGDRLRRTSRPRSSASSWRRSSKGAAQSWPMDNRWETMSEGRFDFGFAVDWMRKDLGDLPRRGAAQRLEPARDRARRPVLRRGAAMGGGRWDTSSLIARLDSRDGPSKA